MSASRGSRTSASSGSRASASSSSRASFVERHALWSDTQQRAAKQIRARIRKDDLQLVRLAWADPQGALRAKTFTIAGFESALTGGCTSPVATSTIDASAARVFASFTPGGGMGMAEMTGSPNMVIVPDPCTFRVLPWEPRVGWVLGEEYFISGAPFHFSVRHLLRRVLARLAARGLRSVIGLEVEWYLYRLAEPGLTDENVGGLGVKGKPRRVLPAEPGFFVHGESNLDRVHAPIAALAAALERLGLPLRSIEKELGPGQIECTFAPSEALEAADNLVLFRAATRQVLGRMGYLASFMCRPGFQGHPSSGWHLHQSLADARTGRNLFAPTTAAAPLAPLGLHYLGGLLEHALAGAVFACPTINGYRRFRANSLAPDRLAWGVDHRGTMLRVLAAPRDPGSRIENRIGEPSANPYLYIAAQLVAGLAGIEARADPGASEDAPYGADRPMLPKSLEAALAALAASPLYRAGFGERFIDYYLTYKRVELERFAAFVRQTGVDTKLDATTEWEQDEYFDFY